MHSLGERGFRLLVAILTVFGFVASITGFIGVGTPVKVAGAVFAVGVGCWVYRAERSPDAFLSPDPWKAALVVALTLLSGFAVAWDEERPGASAYFDFVVNPRNLGLESVAPQPGTETMAAGQHRYGEHVLVTCGTVGAKERLWYRLRDGNFMSDRDLVRAPLSDGWPPEC